MYKFESFFSLLQSKLGFIARLTYKILDIQCRNVLTPPTNGAQRRIMKKISTLTCVNMNRIFMHLMSFLFIHFYYFLVPLEDLILFSVFFSSLPRCNSLLVSLARYGNDYDTRIFVSDLVRTSVAICIATIDLCQLGILI